MRGFLLEYTPDVVGNFLFRMPANKTTMIVDPLFGIFNWGLQLCAVSQLQTGFARYNSTIGLPFSVCSLYTS